MEKNIIELFGEKVITELKKALEERRKEAKEGEVINQAMVRFRVLEVLRTLGATATEATVAINKDYAWLRVQASKEGFYFPIDFGQRRQAKRAELKTLEDSSFDITEAICVAGIYQPGEGTVKYSMKWDGLETVDPETGDLEKFEFSGPVRKWHDNPDGTGYYDGPVAD